MDYSPLIENRKRRRCRTLNEAVGFRPEIEFWGSHGVNRSQNLKVRRWHFWSKSQTWVGIVHPRWPSDLVHGDHVTRAWGTRTDVAVPFSYFISRFRQRKLGNVARTIRNSPVQDWGRWPPQVVWVNCVNRLQNCTPYWFISEVWMLLLPLIGVCTRIESRLLVQYLLIWMRFLLAKLWELCGIGLIIDQLVCLALHKISIPLAIIHGHLLEQGSV